MTKNKGLDWLEEALKRIAAHREANLARFAALDARLAAARRQMEGRWAQEAEVRKALYAALIARRSGQSKPPKRRKRRPGEGGEPMPAVPQPKPRPLSGGAAAPIPRVRATGTAAQPLRVKGRPVKLPSEADRSPSP